jgi:hypothetical protein
MTWTDILVILFPDDGNGDGYRHVGSLAVHLMWLLAQESSIEFSCHKSFSLFRCVSTELTF